jgi:hypothetical protein
LHDNPEHTITGKWAVRTSFFSERSTSGPLSFGSNMSRTIKSGRLIAATGNLQRFIAIGCADDPVTGLQNRAFGRGPQESAIFDEQNFTRHNPSNLPSNERRPVCFSWRLRARIPPIRAGARWNRILETSD